MCRLRASHLSVSWLRREPSPPLAHPSPHRPGNKPSLTREGGSTATPSPPVPSGACPTSHSRQAVARRRRQHLQGRARRLTRASARPGDSPAAPRRVLCLGQRSSCSGQEGVFAAQSQSPRFCLLWFAVNRLKRETRCQIWRHLVCEVLGVKLICWARRDRGEAAALTLGMAAVRPSTGGIT